MLSNGIVQNELCDTDSVLNCVVFEFVAWFTLAIMAAVSGIACARPVSCSAYSDYTHILFNCTIAAVFLQ